MKFHRRWATATVLAAALGASTLSHAALTSLAAVRDSSLPLADYQSGVYSYTQSQLLNDNGIAQASIATGNAMAQAEQGINRVAVTNNAPVDSEFLRANSIGGPFSAAVSVWTDQFTIMGGSGIGTVDVSAHITGLFGSGYGGGGSYFLFVATADQIANFRARPFESIVQYGDVNGAFAPPILQLEQNVVAPGYTDPNPVPPGSLFGGTLTGQLEFTYGQPFYLVSALAGYANDNGSLNAFNTAVFGITAPTGVSIASASGASYPAAVPVPAAVWLFGSGLLGLIGVARRKAA